MSQTPLSDLEQLQRWLQSLITHPGGVKARADAAADQQELSLPAERLETVILPSRQQSSAERLAVYASAYYLRLLDCLREFFPCLRDAMGDEVFSHFALVYLQKYPSQSYTLHRLADQFADFLQETRPPQLGSEAGWEDFFVDLARLEHAIEGIFDAEGPEEPSPPEKGQGKGLSPLSPLTFVPGFQLLAFRYPVSSYYSAWKQGIEPSLPGPQEQYVALFRRDYIVRRHELTLLQHQLLAALQAGETLEESLIGLAPQAIEAGQTADALSADLRDWFEQWTRAGFFLRPNSLG